MILTLVLSVYSANAEKITNRTMQYKTSLRVKAFAKKAESISVPVNWGQIDSCIPDGSYVKKGDIITEFNDEGLTNRLRRLKIGRDLVESRISKTMIDVRNKDLSLKDSLQALIDKQAVLKIKQDGYDALPDKDEIKIAEGRLRIAELEYGTSKKEAEKARDRLKRSMISNAELDKFEFTLKKKHAGLNNAKAHLKYAGLKVSDLLVQKLKLQMSNVQLEIDKLENEIFENVKICEIQEKGSVARKEIIDTKIAECKDDIAKLSVKAPIFGHVMYLRRFRERSLLSGGKLWKKFVYMKMPDMRSLAFKGLLFESQREFFKEGDAVSLKVRCVSSAGLTENLAIEGRIASISRLSHDRSEKEEVGWGEREKSGVMVYDIVINIDDLPEELRIGMHFDSELISSREISGPSVPVYYVKERDGEYFLSFNGRYRQVTGLLVQGYFFLDDVSLLDKKVDLYGEFLRTDDTKVLKTDDKYFCVSGELLPSKTTDVIVKRIFGWQKVTWLIEEDVEVVAGDVVARLDKEETDEEISKITSFMDEDVSVRKALEESTALKHKEGVFNLAKEKNLLAIAEIDTAIARGGRNWSAIFDAEFEVERSKLTVEHLVKRLVRAKGRTSVSPLELSRLKRERIRSELRAEAAVIRLEGLMSGPKALEVKKADQSLLEQKLKVGHLKMQIEMDDFKASRGLALARREESRTDRRLGRLNDYKEHLVLKSPAAGVVQFSKIFNSGVFSKVNVGSAVGYGFVLMQIADLDQMYMCVEVPERYYTMVQKGMSVSVEAPSFPDSGLPGTVSGIKFLFKDKRRKDADLGLYSSHESLGETVFHVYVQIEEGDVEMKPGMIVTVRFPFESKKSGAED